MQAAERTGPLILESNQGGKIVSADEVPSP